MVATAAAGQVLHRAAGLVAASAAQVLCRAAELVAGMAAELAPANVQVYSFLIKQ